jgi:NAD(P)-dependent dehydrogenase (short-subunit alcohol dehydrogenase family)
MTEQIAEPRNDAAGEQIPAARRLRIRAKTMPTAVITGAGSGLGEACTMRMAQRGWTVIALGRRMQELERVARMAPPGTVIPMACDVRNPAAMIEAMHSIRKRHDDHVQGVVHSAGILHIATPEDQLTAWDQVLDTNVKGAVALTLALKPRMPPGSSVVFISSVSGMVASRLRLAYGASKAAINHITKLLAVEMAPRIRVNAVAPGPVETPMTTVGHSTEMRRAYLERTPMGRYVSPFEVARAVEFFLEPGLLGITGQVMAVDGGFSVAGI